MAVLYFTLLCIYRVPSTAKLIMWLEVDVSR